MRASVILIIFFTLFQWVHYTQKNEDYFNNLIFQKTSYITVNGYVNVDGKPSKAIIEIHSTLKNHNNIERVNADSITGQFNASLLVGDEYDMVVQVKRLPQQVLQLNTKKVDSTIKMNVFVDFTSAAYDHKLEALINSNNAKIKKDIQPSSFEKKYGSVKKDKLVYKIQVGAFKFYENFNYTNVIDLPKIIRKTDSDYITRFTMGSYNTYSEAAKILRILQERNLKEAFIIAYYDEQRKLLTDLVNQNILSIKN